MQYVKLSARVGNIGANVITSANHSAHAPTMRRVSRFSVPVASAHCSLSVGLVVILGMEHVRRGT